MVFSYTLAALLLGAATVSSRTIVRTPEKRQSFDFINQTQYNSTPTPVEVSVSLGNGARNQTAPLLYGWMHEDISHSGDGGIYGELLVNRAFQGSGSTIGSAPGIPGGSVISSENPILPWGPVINGWRVIGDASISLTLLQPLSSALPVALQLDIPFNATGEVGIINSGFWGMDVHPGQYNASFYIKANKPRSNGTLLHIDVSLRSNLTSDVWSTSSIPFSPGNNISNFAYTQYAAEINNNVNAPNSNNSFAITFDSAEVAGDTYYIALASLFPETYAGLPNGLRADLGQVIVDLGTKILRFPGGNNIEGYSIDQRWKWNETIGPLKDRRGRVGDWGYVNTQGLGLLEYLEFCEAGGIEPVLAVYAGFSLDIFGQDGVSFPEDQMGLVLDDILNELEYVTGGPDTQYGALRGEHGHPTPFSLNYIEIGNEDWFSSTYNYRFPFLRSGIKAAYPNLTIISTAFNENPDYNITLSPGDMWDTHHYEEASFFVEDFNYFDNWQETSNNPDVTIFIGEYSMFQVDTPSGSVNYTRPPPDIHINYPTLESAITEGIYLLGAERNPNVVKMTAYAPSLANLNFEEWTPNLVTFQADWNFTVLSASYYMEQLFAHYRGSQTLPTTTVAGDFNPLWWVATVAEGDSTVYFKVINSGNSTIPLNLDFDQAWLSVNGTMITSAKINDFNYVGNATAVSPTPINNLPGAGSGQTKFSWGVPALSVNVLQFNMGGSGSSSSITSSSMASSSMASSSMASSSMASSSMASSSVASSSMASSSMASSSITTTTPIAQSSSTTTTPIAESSSTTAITPIAQSSTATSATWATWATWGSMTSSV